MRKVLVYGLGITGISTVKTLDKMGYKVYTFDKNKNTDKRLKGYNYSPISCGKFNEDYNFVVKSPGIKPSDEILKKLYKSQDVISDIELSFRLFKDKDFIAVTGTNGKTTTTSMISHILNKSGKKAISVGNIGEGILWQMHENDAIFVEEVSSFQLHDTKTYKPHIALILNISPDHIDWHGSKENYIEDKLKIVKNQDEKDFLIINHDDKILKDYIKNFKAQIYEFSLKEEVSRGIYLKNDAIFLKDKNKEVKLLNKNDLLVVGDHNTANIMASMLALYIYGLDIKKIEKYAKTFKAISHRLEFVKNIRGVNFYNDSKATNVDAALKAVESFDKNIILIAGGYDKKIDYKDLFENKTDKYKSMILLGETKDKLANYCKEFKIKYFLVDSMKKAIDIAFDIMEKDDTVLLSPASASWGMYDNFKQRGDDFKKEVLERG